VTHSLTQPARALGRLLVLAGAAWLVLSGCGADPTQQTLSQNVGDAFAPCNDSEIKYLARKHNFMLSFRPCANNNFEQYAWSPDGRLLYFQLVLTAYVMDAEADTKNTSALPISTPLGPVAWLTATRLAVPVGPPGDSEPGAPPRLALVEVRQPSTFYVDLPMGFGEVQELERGRAPGEVLALASWKGRRKVWAIDTSTGEVTEPFPFLPADVRSMTFTPAQDVISVGVEGDEVQLWSTLDGKRVATFAPALRGELHPDGVWVMLEHLGEPVSIFYQRSWDELSEQARERELRRLKRFEENLPDQFPREVRPPTLSYANVVSGERFMLESVYGKDFSWYEPTPHFGSFVLWGFEGKQYKRNVMLGNFTDRLRAVEKGRDFLGVVPFTSATFVGPEGGAPAGADPAAPSEAQPDDAESKSKSKTKSTSKAKAESASAPDDGAADDGAPGQAP